MDTLTSDNISVKDFGKAIGATPEVFRTMIEAGELDEYAVDDPEEPKGAIALHRSAGALIDLIVELVEMTGDGTLTDVEARAVYVALRPELGRMWDAAARQEERPADTAMSVTVNGRRVPLQLLARIVERLS